MRAPPAEKKLKSQPNRTERHPSLAMLSFPMATLPCKECHRPFVFPESEQMFFRQNGWADPIRCRICRRQKHAARQPPPPPPPSPQPPQQQRAWGPTEAPRIAPPSICPQCGTLWPQKTCLVCRAVYCGIGHCCSEACDALARGEATYQPCCICRANCVGGDYEHVGFCSRRCMNDCRDE